MPTIIDALTVTFDLDPSNYLKQRKEVQADLDATKKQAALSAQAIEESGKQAAQFFMRMRQEALNLFTVLLGGRTIGGFVNDTVQSLTSLGRAAANIGDSVPQVSALSAAIERAGGTAQETQATLLGLRKALTNWRLTADPGMLAQGMYRMGVQQTDSPIAIYEKFITWAEAHKGDRSLVLGIGQSMGFSDVMINEALKGLGAYRAAMQESFGLGAGRSEDQTRHMTALLDAWHRFTQAMQGAGNAILAVVAPAFTWLLNQAASLAASLPHVTAAIEILGGALTALSVIKLAGSALSILGLLGGGGAAAAGGAAVVGWPVVLALLAAAGVGIGGAYLYDRMHPAAGAGGQPGTTGPGTAYRPGQLAPDIEAKVRQQAGAFNLDPEHMVALARAEGGGRNGVSSAGAIGAMQLMPQTARELGVNPYDLDDNIRGGMMEYSRNLRRFGGNYTVADAAYNAGPGGRGVANLAATGDTSMLPRETQNYVATIRSLSPGRRVAAAVPGGVGGGSSETNIGTIIIQTAAKDADGIAGSIAPALRRRGLVVQANSGLV